MLNDAPLVPGAWQKSLADAGLAWRPAAEADLEAWAALIARTAEVEKPVWFERAADLEQILQSKKNHPAANTVLVLDGRSVLRAYARITKNKEGDKAYGFGCVDPAWQRRGIGSALLEWLGERTIQRFAEDSEREDSGREDSGREDSGREDGGPAGEYTVPRLRIQMEQQHEHQQRLLQKAGFHVVRYFNEMHRHLAGGPLPEVRLDDGLELVTMRPELSEDVRLAHNAAFRDHWGSEPRDEESWGFTVNDPQARPDLSTVVLDRSSGAVAGYQLASHDPDGAVSRGFSEGYTDLLGVRREYRGRGIAQALLADAMRRFAAAGMDRASLDVDSENPTGALALYEKMGYAAVNRSLAWDREVPRLG
ncbi:GNAT family N-acetyltransferase [Arthrobacter sp. ISL-72]|uniref:GNAT family N-acetyltransferase n=1 Tax=Arthrobacter sp. ISL-72 TaxID=2819114 RepID=UPI001BE82B33|nr:GNAT family N-acetyltransferase [Arthrobacter sp. ISL-72]MBT2596488.1 GNAT family N-acetyltransferase [Arthrobacter sp. ISL-72]